MESLGGGWVALLIAALVLGIIVFLIFKSGKQIAFKIPFMPAPFNKIKIGRDSFPKKKDPEAEAAEPTDPRVMIANVFDGIDLLNGQVSKRYDVPIYLVLSQNPSTFELLKDVGNDVLQRLSLKDIAGDEAGSCVVLNHGCLIHHQEPEFVVEELISRRPERPIDGVVIALPVQDLIGGSRQDRQVKFDRLYQQFWGLQKQVEFQLPVYILITDMEEHQGFEAFWSLPELLHQRDQIWGWSNPYAIDKPFQTTWLAEAFRYITDHMVVLSTNVVKRDRGAENVESLMFTKAFSELHESVVTFTEEVFGPGLLQHPWYFRGLYFTGRLPSEGRLQHHFIRDLFKRKIFAENKLAQPRLERLLSADRQLRRLQYGSLLVLLVLVGWSGYDLFKVYEQREHIAQAVLEVNDIWRNSSGYAAIEPLFSIMAEMDASSEYCCGPVPASKLVPIELKIEKYFAEEIFGNRILPVMDCKSRQRIEDITKAQRFRSDGSLKEASFDTWLQVVKGEVQIRHEFDSLVTDTLVERSVGSVADEFSEVVKYLFDADLPAGFFDNADLYIRALADNSFDLELLPPRQCADAVQDISTFWPKMMQAANFEIRHEVERVSAPVGFIEGVIDFESSSIDRVIISNDDFKDYFEWHAYFGESWEGAANSGFCSRTRNELGQVAQAIARNPEQLTGFHGSISDFWQACTSAVGETLETDNRLFLEPIYQQVYNQSELSPRVSEDYRKTFDFFDQMYELSFAMVEPTLISESTGNFFWSVSELHRAIGFYQQYLGFVSSRFDSVQLPDQPGADRTEYLSQAILLSQLQQAMLSTIEKAKTTSSIEERIDLKTLDKKEAKLADRVANFKRSLNPLLELVAAFEQLDLPLAKRSLLMQSQNHAVQLLKDIDELFFSGRAYTPRVTPKWQAHQYLEAFYGLYTESQAKDYLAAQEQRTRILALDFAQPVVIYLSNTDGAYADPDLLGRWMRTLVEINKRQNKDPSNEIEAFEQFFLGDFIATNLSNCHDQVKGYLSPVGGSVFSLMNQNLISRATEHCQGFRADTIKQEYQTVADAFGKHLQAYYPFNNNQNAKPLSPANLRAFLKIYPGVESGLAQKVLVLAWKVPAFEKAEVFISALDESLALLAPIVGAKSGAQPAGIQVEASFEPDVQGNSDSDFSAHISQIRFEVGDEKRVFPGAEGSLTWRFGDPVGLDIQWASGSPYQLYTSAGKLAQGQLSYKAATYWSLIEFIQSNRSTRFDQSALSEDALLLQFNAQVKKSETSSRVDPLETFIRVTLLGVDPETQTMVPLVVPESFPRSPPKIQRR